MCNTRINISNILRHCPQGTALYDLARGVSVRFHNIFTINGDTFIWCTREADGTTFHYPYTELGAAKGYPGGMVILVPSKDMHDWTKFHSQPEFKPFDRVLVRDDDDECWSAAIFSHTEARDPNYPYRAIAAASTVWRQCIPYEGNEHLHGTTNKRE